MTEPAQPYVDASARDEKHRVALSSFIAALALTVIKVVVGIGTNSLGILSEAAHSALDLVAAAITVWAVRVSSRPADREHTYGHGKFENLSAVVETLLLLATCLWIVYEALRRLFWAQDVEVDPNVWAFLVVTVSIVVDFSRSRALRRVARKHQSQALEADALHFTTDIWSSCVVLLGLIGILVAEKANQPWLRPADSVAALGVAGIAIWAGLRLGRKSVADLLDAVPKDFQDRIAATAASVPGVEAVKQVRVRRSGPELFADVTLTVDQAAGLGRAHEIADQTEAAVQAILPRADVVLHVEPTALPANDVLSVVRAVGARHGLAAHGVRIYEHGPQRWLDLHLEVDESLNLQEAHRQATRFEQDLRAAIPGLARIITHLEPAGDNAATQQAQPAGLQGVEEALKDFFSNNPAGLDPHEVEVRWVGTELTVSLHCALDAATAITDAHEFTQRLESYLRSRIPNLGRVVIHAEPAEDSDAKGS